MEARLADAVPQPVTKHAVQINGTWYPVKQAFALAIGVPSSAFVSTTARQHLAALAFPVRSEAGSTTGGTAGTAVASAVSSGAAAPEWHTEANAQSMVVRHLASEGWKIQRVADTAAKEAGIDIVAERDGETLGVEVKGFPSKHYADPARVGQTKRTQPSTQAPVWYAGALLSALRLRDKKPTWRNVIALPDFPRYRNLCHSTRGSLATLGIEVWWVRPDGTVTDA